MCIYCLEPPGGDLEQRRPVISIMSLYHIYAYIYIYIYTVVAVAVAVVVVVVVVEVSLLFVRAAATRKMRRDRSPPHRAMHRFIQLLIYTYSAPAIYVCIIYIYIYIYIYIHIHIHIYIYIYVVLFNCLYTYIYIYIHTHTCIHTHPWPGTPPALDAAGELNVRQLQPEVGAGLRGGWDFFVCELIVLLCVLMFVVVYCIC